jgi:hypothetical protein
MAAANSGSVGRGKAFVSVVNGHEGFSRHFKSSPRLQPTQSSPARREALPKRHGHVFEVPAYGSPAGGEARALGGVVARSENCKAAEQE